MVDEPTKEYNANGATLKLRAYSWAHDNAVAIYERTGTSTSYEVQVLKWVKSSTFKVRGKVFDIKEGWKHPVNEDFGTKGWSYQSLDLAKQKYADMCVAMGLD